MVGRVPGEAGQIAARPPTAALGLVGVGKQFGGFTALIDIDLSFAPCAIHAICGENGAGKSTLVKIISGVLQPSTGSVLVDGRPEVIASPRRAQALGIALVAQELSLCPDLSVADNIWLGSARVPMSHRRRDLADRAAAVLGMLGLGHLDLSAKAGTLRLGERQLVEIARALARDARVLILDEPTATLSDVEIERLFAALQALRAAGRCIIYISHRLGEIFALCNTITTLRNGRLISTGPTQALTQETLVEQMLGRSLGDMFPPFTPAADGVSVAVRGLRVPGRVRHFEAELRGGRILCVVGQVGSGATDVIDALAGLIFDAEGDLHIGGKRVPLGSAGAALEHGVMLVSGDRAREGIFLDLSIADNLGALSLDRCSRLGLLDRRALSRFATEAADAVGVDGTRMTASARTLSGGNQQKLAFGRTLGQAGFGVLLMNEPTRGIDIGARADIYNLMRDACERGWLLIMTSTDLEEVIRLGDVVMTMFRGEVVGRYGRDALTMGRLVADITHPASDVTTSSELVA